MLRLLILFLSVSITATSSAEIIGNGISDSDLRWVKELRNNNIEMIIDNAKSKLQELVDDKNSKIDQDTNLKTKPELRVFVSSSMPKPLLKAYAGEAEQYEAVLVFNGLPAGGFKELIALVSDLELEGKKVAMQIDEESFSRYGIEMVPSLVLSVAQECYSQQSCEIKYDLIGGNVGIKGALRQFADSGDLKYEATALLSATRSLRQ